MTALPLQIYHFLPTAFKNVLIGYTIKVAICLQEIEKCIHSPLAHITFKIHSGKIVAISRLISYLE